MILPLPWALRRKILLHGAKGVIFRCVRQLKISNTETQTNMSPKKPKIIVVGGGISGSMAALAASGGEAEVILITPAAPRRSRSASLREGISAALNTEGEGDSPALHAQETLACGEHLSNPAPVSRMCEAAPGIVGLFDRMGVMFERSSEGMIELKGSPGSSKRRVASTYPATGHSIISALDAQLRRKAHAGQIQILEGWEFLSLVLDDSRLCRGAVAVNLKNMEVKAMASDAVVMCAGGFQGIFGKVSTDRSCTGAAIAACFEQGARFANPEFVELHPYTIASEEKRIPIDDAILKAGGRILCSHAQRRFYFLEEWFPESDGLVTHSVALRATWKAVQEAGLGSDNLTSVELDLSNLDPEWIEHNIVDLLSFYQKLTGEDPIETPMKIKTGVHRTLGGLLVDDAHATNIRGLFAGGGAACQYHGAGVLNGNGILACAFGGRRAAESALSYSLGSSRAASAFPASLLDSAKAREDDLTALIASRQGTENAHALERELEDALAVCASIVKDNSELKKASAKVAEISDRFSRAALADRAEWANGELIFMRKFRHSLALASLTLTAAIARDESRGAHFKPEFPERDDKRWGIVTTADWSEQGVKLQYSTKIADNLGKAYTLSFPSPLGGEGQGEGANSPLIPPSSRPSPQRGEGTEIE